MTQITWPIKTKGAALLANPLLNKGTAFSDEERRQLALNGLIPPRCETLAQQAERAYLQYSSFVEPIHKHIYLRMVQDTNETLFYFLLNQHLDEMMPIIYTPTVGEACEHFSEIYRRPRGVFISYADREQIADILGHFAQIPVQIIVVTDGSRILGLGDLGAGGMAIPIGKLSLYTVCGGIYPGHTLPIMLDLGTDNPDLLKDPHYIGWQHPRISAAHYDAFMADFIQAVQHYWPDVLLQFEDFDQRKALPLLNTYRDQLCCFNDDIQGTAAVTVGTLLAACRSLSVRLTDQLFVFAGAGAAGCGIAAQLIKQLCHEGLTLQQAKQRILMVDRQGLLTRDLSGLLDFQQALAQDKHTLPVSLRDQAVILLDDVIQYLKPTVLIGVSGQAGLFSESLIRTLHSHCPHPVILPLSNPSRQIEAHPQQLIEWTQGQALVATGSPFAPVIYQHETYPIAQCNNSYIFPGLGLAVAAAGVQRITDEMLMAASQILADNSPRLTDPQQSLLPPLSHSAEISRKIALAVAKVAISQQLAPAATDHELQVSIESTFWQPRYQAYTPAVTT